MIDSPSLIPANRFCGIKIAGLMFVWGQAQEKAWFDETTTVDNNTAGIMKFLLWRNNFGGVFAYIFIVGW